MAEVFPTGLHRTRKEAEGVLLCHPVANRERERESALECCGRPGLREQVRGPRGTGREAWREGRVGGTGRGFQGHLQVGGKEMRRDRAERIGEPTFRSSGPLVSEASEVHACSFQPRRRLVLRASRERVACLVRWLGAPRSGQRAATRGRPWGRPGRPGPRHAAQFLLPHGSGDALLCHLPSAGLRPERIWQRVSL